MIALVAVALLPQLILATDVEGRAPARPLSHGVAGAPPSIARLPSNCGQCIVVTTPSWPASTGTLRAFNQGNDGEWRLRGEPVPVRVGNAGLAWGRGLFDGNHLSGPRKIEGDKKAPAGIFKLLFCFGYQQTPAATRMRYRAVDAATVTVDDPHSRFYNQMLEATSVAHPDWKSAEKMRLPDDRYKWGIVVGHNVPPVPGAGSCIFMHVWKDSDTATVGCTAMPERAILDLLHWLDPAKHPLLIQMPLPVYREIFPTFSKCPAVSESQREGE